MKSFYLSKNQDGYYRVYFVDPVTGARSVGKSTHTKDRDETILNNTYMKWCTKNNERL